MENKDEIVIYKREDGKAEIAVTLHRENLWLSLNQIAELFGRDKSVISRHLRKIFDEGELDREATVAFFATVQNEGGRRVERQVEYFDLDVILSVGYRVNSKRGTLFRIWSNNVLREYLIKGDMLNRRRRLGEKSKASKAGTDQRIRRKQWLKSAPAVGIETVPASRRLR